MSSPDNWMTLHLMLICRPAVQNAAFAAMHNAANAAMNHAAFAAMHNAAFAALLHIARRCLIEYTILSCTMHQGGIRTTVAATQQNAQKTWQQTWRHSVQHIKCAFSRQPKLDCCSNMQAGYVDNLYIDVYRTWRSNMTCKEDSRNTPLA